MYQYQKPHKQRLFTNTFLAQNQANKILIIEVMEEVIKAGKKEGYEILIWEDGAYEEVKRYRITLVYTIRLPILSLEKQREISGYAL